MFDKIKSVVRNVSTSNSPNQPFDLEKEIVIFNGIDPKGNKDQFSLKIKDLITGTAIFGSTGSGKTSGSAYHILRKCFQNNFGSVCTCVKPDDAQNISEIAEQEGRKNDVFIFSKENEFTFNPFTYELEREDRNKGDIDGLIQLLVRINEFVIPNSSKGEDQAFWQMLLSRIMDRSINLLIMAGEEVSFSHIKKIILGASTHDTITHQINTYNDLIQAMPDANSEEQDIIAQELIKLGRTNYMLYSMMQAEMRNNDEEDMELCRDFFFTEFFLLGDKTKSSVIEIAMGMIEYFIKKGIIKNKFATSTDERIKPENTWLKGAIIILDFPIKEFDMIGRLAQNIYRLSFMQAAERRKADGSGLHRPVVLFQDEFHLTMNPEYDDKFQSTCRSSLIATISITQNLNNLYLAMGNENKALSLLGNMNTKIFHANSNDATNQYASKVFSEDKQEKTTKTISDNPSKTISEEYQPQFRPIEMTRLRTGGKSNGSIVEAFITNESKYFDWKQTNVIKVKIKQ